MADELTEKVTGTAYKMDNLSRRIFIPRLTEQEQQEIIRFLEAGKPLPDKYRFLLFEDKREVELVGNGSEEGGVIYAAANTPLIRGARGVIFPTIPHLPKKHAKIEKIRPQPKASCGLKYCKTNGLPTLSSHARSHWTNT